MADITDPVAIAYCNQEVRPLAELVRGMLAYYESVRTSWYGGLNLVITNTADPIIDNRQDDGVTQLTGADVNSLMSIMEAMRTASNSEIVEKPCVRPLNVT